MIIKHFILTILACVYLQVMACGNNENKKIKDIPIQKDSIVSVEEQRSIELSKTVIEEDTSRYKIEFITYGDLITKNPEFTKDWNKLDGLNWHTVHTINFIERKTNEIIRTYDLEKESPFANLPLKAVGRDNDAGIKYRIDESNPIRFKIKKQDYISDYKAKSVLTYYGVESLHNRPNSKAHIALNYCAEFYNKSHQLIGITSEIHILNNQGKTVHKLKNIDTEVAYLSTTEDGLYAVFSRGGPLNEDEEALDNDGIEIFDVVKNKKIITIESTQQYQTSIPYVIGNTIFTSLTKIDASTYHYQIYRPKDNVMYSTDFSRDEMGTLKKVDEYGVEKVNPKTKERTSIKFEKDFLATKIFEK